MIDILLIEEQILFGEAVRSSIHTAADIGTVELVSTEQEALTYIKENHPNVVLIDIHMKKTNAIQVAAYIKENHPNVKVIFFTTYEEKDLVVDGISAGADGFLLKDIDKHNLVQSIYNAHHGQVVISGEAAKILAERITSLKHGRGKMLKEALAEYKINLTNREIDVALLVVDGLSNPQISERLNLSEGTIKNYISYIYKKIEVSTRTEAIIYLQGLLVKFFYGIGKNQEKMA